MTATTIRQQGWRPYAAIIAIIAAAIALRFWAALPLAQHHTDEIGQYLEQAHRLVFGYGVVPWEYREGMRSWLMPLLISAPMALGGAAAPDSMAYMILPKLLMGLCSLAILWAGWRLGRAVSPLHGWVTLAVAALWYEFALMGVRVLTEPLATAAIMAGGALLLVGQPNRRALMLGGFLLAIGVVLRFHYGPAVALIGLATLWGHWRERFVPMLIGGLGAATLSGAVDLWAGQIPFAWIVTNVRFNIVHDVASQFGVSPPTAYLGAYIESWGWARIPIFLAILPAIRRHRVLFWTALVNLGVHSLIGHKEYRFVYLTTTIFILLSAIGTVEIGKWLLSRLAPRAPQWAVLALIPAWMATSASLGATGPRVVGWDQFGATMGLMAKAGQMPGSCGVAVELTWIWTSGSYAALHRNVPIYLEAAIDPAVQRGGTPLAALAGYNRVIGPETLGPLLPPGYRVAECRASGRERDLAAYADGARVCLFQRPGPCSAAGLERHRVQAVIERYDR
jgi:GPI mannosyltransferase 3